MKYIREELEKIIREKYTTGDKILANHYDVEGVIKDIEKIRIYKNLQKVSVPCKTDYGVLSFFYIQKKYGPMKENMKQDLLKF
jgi:MoxR-like ATPase